jgi:hypothetical protein
MDRAPTDPCLVSSRFKVQYQKTCRKKHCIGKINATLRLRCQMNSDETGRHRAWFGLCCIAIARVRTSDGTHTHVHIHMYTHTCTHTHAHTARHTHTHTHTHTPYQQGSASSSCIPYPRPPSPTEERVPRSCGSRLDSSIRHGVRNREVTQNLSVQVRTVVRINRVCIPAHT